HRPALPTRAVADPAPLPPHGPCYKRCVSVKPSEAMSQKQIMRLVNLYIGVEGGYLGDFSYRTHREFYPLYCDLDLNPDEYEGTTRERFIEILSSRPPHEQAKIIRGVMEKYPVGSSEIRAQAMHDGFLALADR